MCVLIFLLETITSNSLALTISLLLKSPSAYGTWKYGRREERGKIVEEKKMGTGKSVSLQLSEGSKKRLMINGCPATEPRGFRVLGEEF